jgi:DNA mismatch endonuclease (patch repair protein)
MSGIRGKNTKPELVLRSGLHKAGFRFRIHDRRLPGSPDLVLPRHKAVIFVHGCFWHGHECPLFKWPKTRHEFWEAKILGNVARDTLAIRKLHDSGWRVLVVWECALKGSAKLGEAAVVALAVDWLNSDEMQRDIRGT